MTKTGNTNLPGAADSVTLWSSLPDICKLLNTPFDHAMANEECRFQHVQYKAGQRIYTVGQTFEMLYIVSAGFLKNVMIDGDGNEQILSFPMKGDLLGVDGIHRNQYCSEVAALSDCTVILLPFKQLSLLGKTYVALENAMYGAMSRELMRDHTMVAMLSSLSAEARVARFIIYLSDRFAGMGYSSKQFNLCMTRQEIGSYLGMTLETASRMLSSFDQLGIISLKLRSVEILDLQALQKLRRMPRSHHNDAKKTAFSRLAA